MPLRRYLAEVSEVEHEALVHHLNTTVIRQEMILLKLLHSKFDAPRPRLDQLKGPFWVRLDVPDILTSEDGPVKPLSDEDFEKYAGKVPASVGSDRPLFVTMEGR